MASPTKTSSPCNNQGGALNRRSTSNSDIITFLENSPKGRLVYQNGWDESPNSIWQFVKTVQAKSEEKKYDVIERGHRACEVASRRSLSSLEISSSTTITKMASNSCRNKSLNESQLSQQGTLTPSPVSNTSFGINSSSSQSLTSTPVHTRRQPTRFSNISESNMTIAVCSTKKNPKRSSLSAKYLGIREEDNNFDGINDEDLEPQGCSFLEMKNILLKIQNKELLERITKKQKELNDFKEEYEQKAREYALTAAKATMQMTMEINKRIQEEDENLKLESIKTAKARQMFQEKDDHKFETQRRVELKKLSEAQKQAEQDIQKKFEEQQLNERLVKEKELAENLEKERLLKAEAEKAAAEIAKLENEKLAKTTLQQIPKGNNVPPELANVILGEDLQRYTKLIMMEEEYEKAVCHISSSNPAVNDYYFGALKVVNTPLNLLANLSESHLQQKVAHFLDLLSGKPVITSDTMKSPFQATALPCGNLFIMKLLAYRFIKKSGTEITKHKSCIDSLACVGVQLCKRFPEWATLVHANFYKMCPFLVPFSFPRNDDSLEQYAKRMGLELSGGESAMLQTLLDRITGYCTLYAGMVKQFENHKIDDIGESTGFFSIGEVWKILSATMRLEPQLDVTATTIHVLLDILGDRLQAVYGKQFLKLIHYLVNIYLPKLKSVTPAGKAGSLTRLTVFIKQKWYQP